MTRPVEIAAIAPSIMAEVLIVSALLIGIAVRVAVLAVAIGSA